MKTVLIDTNVLIYLHDVHETVKQPIAQTVLATLAERKAGRTSVQNLAEFFHVTTRSLKPPLTADEAITQVELFQQMWPVFDLTFLIVLEAARGVRDHQLSYYDAQLWATARLHQIPFIISEDFQTGRTLEGVTFLNPFVDGFEIEEWL
jgi:predicted nucleic acid-binding protein